MEFRKYEPAEDKDLHATFDIVCRDCNEIIDSICINPKSEENLKLSVVSEMLDNLTYEIIGKSISQAVKGHKECVKLALQD